jgi:hypothetical protein
MVYLFLLSYEVRKLAKPWAEASNKNFGKRRKILLGERNLKSAQMKRMVWETSEGRNTKKLCFGDAFVYSLLGVMPDFTKCSGKIIISCRVYVNLSERLP